MKQLSKEQLIGIVALVIALGVFAFFYLRSTSPAVPAETAATASSTSTPEAVVPNIDGSTLPIPPAPVFTLPAGAVAIDEYAYVNAKQVFFKPVTKTNQALPVQNVDAATFARASEVKKYFTDATSADCGGGATYVYYADIAHAYLYQVWNTTTFRGSQVEPIPGGTKANFKAEASGNVMVGSQEFALGYAKTDTTCRLTLTKKGS